MPQVKVDWTIGIGHLLSLGALIIAVIGGWITFDTRIAQNKEHNDETRKLVEKVADIQQSQQTAIATLSANQTMILRILQEKPN